MLCIVCRALSEIACRLRDPNLHITVTMQLPQGWTERGMRKEKQPAESVARKSHAPWILINLMIKITCPTPSAQRLDSFFRRGTQEPRRRVRVPTSDRSIDSAFQCKPTETLKPVAEAIGNNTTCAT